MNRGFRRYKRIRAGKDSLDLGLSGLMGGDAEGQAPEREPEDEVAGNAGPEKPPEEQTPPNEFEKFAAAGQWGELAAFCEKILAEKKPGSPAEALDPELAAPGRWLEAESRLWWIKAQLREGLVPSMILAAPLDSLSKELAENKAAEPDPLAEKLHGLAAELLFVTAASLEPQGNQELAIQFVSRACLLRPASRRKIADFLLQLPEDRRLDFQAKLPAGLTAAAKHEAAASAVGETPAAAGAVPGSAAERAETGRRTSPLRSAVVAGALLMIGLFVFLLVRSGGGYAFIGVEDSEAPTLSVVSPIKEDVAAIPPQAERIASVSHLDAVFYDIQRSPERAERPRDGERGKNAGGERIEAPKVNGHDVIDTSSPREPPEVARIFRRPAEEQPVSHDEQGEDDAESTADEADDSDGDEDRHVTERAGSPRGTQIYKKPRMFEILAATSVMREPSIRADVLAELKEGDKIMVVAREGAWLKIRSRRSGRAGYVLGQDASPERQW